MNGYLAGREVVVVQSDQGPWSLWPAARPPPSGWTVRSAAGPLSAGTALIDRLQPANRRHLPGPPAMRVAAQVFAAARAAPEAVAIRGSDGAALTYGALAERAGTIAAGLRARGVGQDQVVAVLLERGPELVAAMLGILSAGAAYFALEPHRPHQWQSFMLGDVRAGYLLTDEEHQDRVRLRPGVVRLSLDGAFGHDLPRRAPLAPVEVEAEDLAYVIYTSGSTGTPRGVAVPHRGLGNLVAWHLRAFAPRAGDRAPLFSGPGFDASIWELWPYLCAGAAVDVVEDGVHMDPRAVQDWLLGHQITAAFLPTPMAERVLDLSWPGDAPLRLLLTGGDQLHTYPRPELPFALHNNYGPAECSVVSTSTPVEPRVAPAALSPPLGEAIDGMEILLLDGDLAPVGAGERGEIFVAGEGLARTYLGRPGFTAASFLPDPRPGRAGQRIYRTADWGRREPTGGLSFLGRVTQQQERATFHLEMNLDLGDIARRLRAVPGVREAVVLRREDLPPDEALVAYYVGGEGPLELDALVEALPRALRPSHFVCLSALPLTSNGKLDRRALPAPGPAR